MSADKKRFAICVDNSDYEASLILRKIYEVIPDEIGPGREMAQGEHGFEVGVQAAGVGVRSHLPIGFGGLLGQIIFREQVERRVERFSMDEFSVLEPDQPGLRSQLEILLDQYRDIRIAQDRKIDGVLNVRLL